MKSFVARYQQGACEQVWNELYALGNQIRSDLLYPEALAVAHETMRRVRVNIELLIPRLQTIGYEFGYEWLRASDPHNASLAEWIAEQPAIYAPPSEKIGLKIAQFEQETGLLPLSLRAFYLEVGSVNFVGWHPRWDRFSRPEPLYIAPGELEKYYTSGAGGYEMEFPNAAIDGRLLREWHKTTFVNYLRMCLRYGGISGLESIEHFIEEDLAYLRKDLLPI